MDTFPTPAVADSTFFSIISTYMRELETVRANPLLTPEISLRPALMDSCLR